MLSDELDGLAELFDPYLRDGKTMYPRTLALLVAKFRSLAGDARALERMRIPVAAQIDHTDLADGTVVLLEDHRIERARFGAPRHGGDAA